MGWITLVVGIAVVGAIVAFASRWIFEQLAQEAEELETDRGRAAAGDYRTKDGFIRLVAWGVVGFVLLVSTCSSSVHQIPFGHVGILTQFGAIEGQITEGLQVIPPWKGIMLANVQVQGLGFRGKDHLQSFSKESQDVFVEATLNFKVTPEAIQALYREVGPNYVETLVVPRVKQNFKDETVKYESVQIAPHREEIRRLVRDRLEKELSRNSIEVVDLLLDNVDFGPKFKQSIEDKQVATQKALEERERVKQREAEADQAFAVASGEARATRERANGQADANRALAASLTQEVIQFQALQKLSDKIQIALIPSGQGIIIDPAQLLGRSQPQR